MLKISDFSKLSRISVRMLRFYDENDVLKPIIVKENGYRYYETKQLLIASRIQYLRYLGFGTDKIKSILTIYHNSKEIAQYLKTHLIELEAEQKQVHERINALTMTIKKMEQEEIMMNYQVEIKEIPSMEMMCLRKVIPSYDKEELLWQGLCSELESRKMKIQYVENAISMAVFHDQGYKEKDIDVEIRVQIKGQYEDTENIKFETIPAVKVASVTFIGGYEHCTEVSYHIAKWISEHNYEINGPDFSIYHVGYGKTNNPNEFVTEICYPIK